MIVVGVLAGCGDSEPLTFEEAQREARRAQCREIMQLKTKCGRAIYIGWGKRIEMPSPHQMQQCLAWYHAGELPQHSDRYKELETCYEEAE